MQVIGEPHEVTIAGERIAAEMPADSETNRIELVPFLWQGTIFLALQRLNVAQTVKSPVEQRRDVVVVQRPGKEQRERKK